MPSTILINPFYETLVRRHRLDDFDRMMQWQGDQRVGRQFRRHIDPIDLDDDGRPIRLFLKREWQTYLKDRFRNWLAGLGWGTKARREWHVLTMLGEAGLGCAEPVIAAERPGFRPQGYLILCEIPGAELLCPYLARRSAAMTVTDRRQFWAHLGSEVARLHGLGIDHPDLYSKHILLTPSREPGRLPRVSFIDLQRSSTRPAVSISRRVHNLAAFDATLPEQLATATDRLTFLQSYLSFGPSTLDVGPLAAAIRRRSRRLRSRRKIRELLEIGSHASLTLSESAKLL
jgi:tRNA A-37 threonylcarbamoyl transferase component Bud32